MKLGLIGCGKMGSALLRGVLASSKCDVSEVWIFDPYPAAVEALLKEDSRIQAAESNGHIADLCDVTFLCVKPPQVAGVAREMAIHLHESLVISVAAGVKLATLEENLGEHQRAIRVMPNTPALVGKGASAFALGSRTLRSDLELTVTLLESVGIACQVEEALLDSVTGLSGSGPAYVYLIIEALADGGVMNGLPRHQALELAAQTVLGAAQMVIETGRHPAVLKDEVTSPGGTTIRGLEQLERGGVRSALMDAVSAATLRSRDLG